MLKTIESVLLLDGFILAESGMWKAELSMHCSAKNCKIASTKLLKSSLSEAKDLRPENLPKRNV